MKRIYNISDVPSPKMALLKKARLPKTFRVGSEMVEPGRYIDVHDSFPLRTIAGLLEDEVLSVGSLPKWYQPKKAELTAARLAAKKAEKEAEKEAEKPEPKSKPRSKKKKGS